MKTFGKNQTMVYQNYLNNIKSAHSLSAEPAKPIKPALPQKSLLGQTVDF